MHSWCWCWFRQRHRQQLYPSNLWAKDANFFKRCGVGVAFVSLILFASHFLLPVTVLFYNSISLLVVASSCTFFARRHQCCLLLLYYYAISHQYKCSIWYPFVGRMCAEMSHSCIWPNVLARWNCYLCCVWQVCHALKPLIWQEGKGRPRRLPAH